MIAFICLGLTALAADLETSAPQANADVNRSQPSDKTVRPSEAPYWAALAGQRGLTAFQKQQWDEAVVAFKEALQHTPDDPRWHFNLGCVELAQSHLEEAATAFQDACRTTEPNLAAAAYHNLGLTRTRQALAQLGDNPRTATPAAQSAATEALFNAVHAYRRCLKLQPDHPSARQNLETILLWLKQAEQAWQVELPPPPDPSTTKQNWAEQLRDMLTKQRRLRMDTSFRCGGQSTPPQTKSRLEEQQAALANDFQQLQFTVQQQTAAFQAAAPKQQDPQQQRMAALQAQSLATIAQSLEQNGPALTEAIHRAAEQLRAQQWADAVQTQRQIVDTLESIYPAVTVLMDILKWIRQLERNTLAQTQQWSVVGNQLPADLWLDAQQDQRWVRQHTQTVQTAFQEVVRLTSQLDEDKLPEALKSYAEQLRQEKQLFQQLNEKAEKILPEIIQRSESAETSLQEHLGAPATIAQRRIIKLLDELIDEIEEAAQQANQDQESDQQQQNQSESESQNSDSKEAQSQPNQNKDANQNNQQSQNQPMEPMEGSNSESESDPSKNGSQQKSGQPQPDNNPSENSQTKPMQPSQPQQSQKSDGEPDNQQQQPNQPAQSQPNPAEAAQQQEQANATAPQQKSADQNPMPSDQNKRQSKDANQEPQSEPSTKSESQRPKSGSEETKNSNPDANSEGNPFGQGAGTGTNQKPESLLDQLANKLQDLGLMKQPETPPTSTNETPDDNSAEDSEKSLPAPQKSPEPPKTEPKSEQEPEEPSLEMEATPEKPAEEKEAEGLTDPAGAKTKEDEQAKTSGLPEEETQPPKEGTPETTPANPEDLTDQEYQALLSRIRERYREYLEAKRAYERQQQQRLRPVKDW